jgi:hypothetical protein
MSVYIHEPLLSGQRLYSRLTADSEDELHDCGELLGLQPEWIKEEGTPGFHLEVYGTKLRLALAETNIQYLTLKQFEEYLRLKLNHSTDK